MRSRKIVFAGGGTAGHIQPALAVAQLWRQSHPDDEIVFLGTSSGLETKLVPEAGLVPQLQDCSHVRLVLRKEGADRRQHSHDCHRGECHGRHGPARPTHSRIRGELRQRRRIHR